jgi:hypothetical protein
MTQESRPMRNSVAELLAAEAEAAEQLSDEEDLGPSYAPRRPAKDPSQVYSVRIPVGRLEQLRQRAAEKGIAPSALMRQWVTERLDADESVKRTLPNLEVLAAAVSAVLQSPQVRRLDEALWMVARAEDDERVLIFQEKVFADEESADEEARSSGGVVIPLPVARDYRPGRKRAEA